MRLGAHIARKIDSPAEWIKFLKAHGYSAAYCPVKPDAASSEIQAYKKSAADSNIVIAEVGIWQNLIHPDEETRKKNREFAKSCLALADEIGALCAVNVAGSRSGDGRMHDQGFSDETFELVIASVREVIDAVNPKTAYYTLEFLPQTFPDSPDNYLEIIKAVDREQFAVHLDPVNIICTHRRYSRRNEIVEECFDRLGPYIKSCHIKDVKRDMALLTHIDECPPGQGTLDLSVFLAKAEALSPDLPLMLEHMRGDDTYTKAADHIRQIAEAAGIHIITD